MSAPVLFSIGVIAVVWAVLLPVEAQDDIDKCHAIANKAGGESMIQQRRQLVQQPVVLWGIESNSKLTYENMVEAQLKTWANDIPREELVIVGGKFDDHLSDLTTGDGKAGGCDDGPRGLPCKEAVLLTRAAKRANGLNVDWVMVSQEDKYIWPKAVRKALSKLNSSEPAVIGSVGCGRGWKYNPDSVGGSKPYPRDWVEPENSCTAVHEHGGLCGGTSYFVSRGALEKLLKFGQTQASFLEEFTLPQKHNPGAGSDMLASCMYYDRGIALKQHEPLVVNSYTFVEGDEVSQKMSHMNSPVAAHLNLKKEKIPAVMYQLSKLDH